MIESARTGVYVIIGVLALGLAWWAKPATIERGVVDDKGERFFPEFDTLTATRLEVITFDEDTSSKKAFQVAQHGGLWSIPSRDNYPADAKDRLARAAAAVVDLTKGPSVTDSPADHALYGVVDPKSVDDSADGVGTRVTLENDSGKVLVDLIIGKSVKDTPQIRFVRVPGRDRVYQTKISTTNLTTKFEDWIERDLLKISPPNISMVRIRDYSIDELNNRIDNRDTLELTYSLKGNEWSMDGLGPSEELDTEKLDSLRFAMREIRIVDVRKKPAGLSEQLTGDGSLKIDGEALASLQNRGYYIVQGQLLSNEGELIVGTSEGVQYTLRFGEIARFETGVDLDEMNEAESTDTGRYLFVTTQFEESLIDQPEFQPVPDEPTEEETTADASAAQAKKTLRETILAENDKNRSEYEEKLESGRTKVKELNARFADWYYVVSDDVYQKIRLRRSDIVKPKSQTDSNEE